MEGSERKDNNINVGVVDSCVLHQTSKRLKSVFYGVLEVFKITNIQSQAH